MSLFKDFDFANFWRKKSDYALKTYIESSANIDDQELIKKIEKTLGYKLPQSYLEFMRYQNGGVPIKNCHASPDPTSWAEDHVAISAFLAIGETVSHSLLGELGSRFMIEEWEYPDIGIMICDCPSAGHDAIFLDYRKCGQNGEPAVVHVDQDFDFKITHLADSFSEFVQGLVSDDFFAEEEEELDEQGLTPSMHELINSLEEKGLSSYCTSLVSKCAQHYKSEELTQVLQDNFTIICRQIIKNKGFFAVHNNKIDCLLLDFHLLLLLEGKKKISLQNFLKNAPRLVILALDGFSGQGLAPAFLENYISLRCSEQKLLRTMNEQEHSSQDLIEFSPDYLAKLEQIFFKPLTEDSLQQILFKSN